MLAMNHYPEDEHLEVSVLSVLTYFDLFSFPITLEEIHLFMDTRCSVDGLLTNLISLEERKAVYKLGNYYAVKNDPYLVFRRERGFNKAIELLKVAEKVSTLLIKFPYVRGIAVSGSLSKKYADENSDVDFFVITKTGKLWIARTILHLFKKLTFLLHKEDYFCMNYFVDEENAEIIEQNLFTAIETVTLIPMQGDITFEKFYRKNTWTRFFLPNNIFRISQAQAVDPGAMKKFAEALFNNQFGHWLNRYLMQLTARRWQQKTDSGRLNARGVLMSMLAGEGYAKPDPVNFQRKVLEDHQRNLNRMTERLAHPVS